MDPIILIANGDLCLSTNRKCEEAWAAMQKQIIAARAQASSGACGRVSPDQASR
jgi:hypothetical protein